MRKIIMLSATILLISVSCKQEKSVDYALISGKILNQEKEVNILSADDPFFYKAVNLSEDGRFSDTLRLDEGLYMLHDGKNMARLYIENGMDININVDVKDFKNTLNVSGKGSEKSNYYIEKFKIARGLVGDQKAFNKLEEEPFKAKGNQLKKELEQVLDTFNGISEGFKVKERRNIHFNYLENLRLYEFNHSYYAENRGFKVSEGYISELDDVDYENEEDYGFSSAYRQILREYFVQKTKTLARFNSIPYNIAYMKTIGGIQSEMIKNDLLFRFLESNIGYASNLEDYYAAFMSVSTNDKHKSQITETYNKLKVLLKGKPSPKFVNYENFKGGTTSLDDFKGKYVYIDIWATWCGPCIAEAPFIKKLEKEYRGKDIEFVSISVDNSKAYSKWKKMVKSENLIGTQLIADNDFKSEFIQDYLITGIPRFILIDPNGNIVSSEAPLPSDPELVKLFSELDI